MIFQMRKDIVANKITAYTNIDIHVFIFTRFRLVFGTLASTVCF